MQVDNHVAELTVRETLDFGARVLGVGHKDGALTSFFPVRPHSHNVTHPSALS